jgi:stress-induced morphogen
MKAEDMEKKLLLAYPGCEVHVIDLTGTSDHFEVHIASDSFRKLSRIDQHKGVMAVFSEELKTGEVHALSIKTMTR